MRRTQRALRSFALVFVAGCFPPERNTSLDTRDYVEPPVGIGEPCLGDEGCSPELICVKHDGRGHVHENECWPPCLEDRQCEQYGWQCWSCIFEPVGDPPFCEAFDCG